jgi:hypothetical protein
MEALRKHVERIVRPIRAGGWRKNRMREELLDHLLQAYAQRRDDGMNDADAAATAIQNMGDPDAVRRELQASVPVWERAMLVRLPGADIADNWYEREDGESRGHYVASRTLFTIVPLVAIFVCAFIVREAGRTFGLFDARPITSVATCVGSVFLLMSMCAAATAISYYVADASGLLNVLSKRHRHGVVARTLALGAFIVGYLALFLTPAILFAETLGKNTLNNVGVIYVLTSEQPLRAYAAIGIALAIGVPFSAWAITREHQHYEKWGQFDVE